MEDFDWRISVADVSADAPFSDFGPVDRTLCVLRGKGIDLVLGYDLAMRLTPTSAPFTFDGHAPVHGHIVDGPITDLNVMTRRGRYEHTVTRVDITTNSSVFAGANHMLIFAETAFELKNGLIKLDADDALLLEPGEASVTIEAASGKTSVILVTLSRVGRRPAN